MKGRAHGRELFKVVVGLSGGVDSAVSAALLKEVGQGRAPRSLGEVGVVGAFIKTWSPEWMPCTWKEERRDAMRVAAHLDIPFITIDLEREYKEGVADYMIAEYEAGRTPNPDVMCNKEIKFGAFLQKAIAMGADAIATGHYSQTQSANGKAQMLRGEDDAKDQSYFLWTIGQEQLSKTIFPIGHLLKSEVRELAKKYKLPVASKKDSQGLCFLGKVDMNDFLSHYIKTKSGDVLDEGGGIIGRHDGALLYTLGQAWHRPYYVLNKDLKNNTITVGELGESNKVGKKVYELAEVNWIDAVPKANEVLSAQTRYHGEIVKCKVTDNTVRFDEAIIIAPGQSVVLYDGKICLGGGVVM